MADIMKIFENGSMERVLVTVGHHVCRKGTKAYLQKNAPFRSVSGKNDSALYLGDGFYFWDDNIERAHQWGKVHYKGDYSILEYPILLKGTDYLDLVGSRQDLKTFSMLMGKVRKRQSDATISQCITVLQKMEESKPGLFPYKAIRVMDVSSKGNTLETFVKEKRGRMPMNPCYIICVYAKDLIPIREAHIVE